jgi:hypothetical protein
MFKVNKFRLRNAPFEAKIMIVGFLLSLSLAYVYALGNIALVIGWSPKDIAVHYYGADEPVSAEKSAASGEQSLSLDNLETKKELGPRPSFKNLVQEGHFHLFGMTSFFFGLTFLGLFTNLREGLKATLVGTPYFAIIFDNLSFMATRFMGPKFAYLTAISGGFMAICFTSLWIAIGLEILKKPEET